MGCIMAKNIIKSGVDLTIEDSQMNIIFSIKREKKFICRKKK